MDHVGLASFGVMRGQVSDACQQTDNTAYTQFIKDRLNWNLFDAYQRHDWRDLRRFHEGKHTEISDADNLSAYSSSTLESFWTNGYEAMPFDVGEIYAFTRGTPSGTMASPPVLTQYDQAEFFEAIAFDPDQTGEPEIWTLAGTTPLQRPLVVNERLALVSTSAQDTTTVRLSGFTSAAEFGLETAETITLTGTTQVTTSAYAKGWSILSVVVNGALVGTVTLRGFSSGVTYLTVFPASGVTDGPNLRQRLLVRMWPCASAGKPYSLLYKRKCAKLINDLDVPLWPVSPYLVEKSIADTFERLRLPELAAPHVGKAENLLARMIQNEESAVLHLSRPMSYTHYMRGYHAVRPGP